MCMEDSSLSYDLVNNLKFTVIFIIDFCPVIQWRIQSSYLYSQLISRLNSRYVNFQQIHMYHVIASIIIWLHNDVSFL